MTSSTTYRQQLDALVVGQNCTAEEYQAVVAEYNQALVREWDENNTFELMFAGAGSLE